MSAWTGWTAPKGSTYRIRNTFLPTGHLEETLSKTFDMYLRKDDLQDSPLVEWGRRALAEGVWWYDCDKKSPSAQESCIQARQVEVLVLYEKIKKNGYDGSPISVFFDKEGKINTYDGFHRLCIMKYLDMEVDLNIVISYHDKNPERRGDFPLAKTLREMNKGKNLYQPVDDPRLRDFGVWRKDSPARLKYVLGNLKGETVLDIGCSAGYFSREIAKKGYTVTALDNSRKNIAVTRYLSIINNLKLNYHLSRWQEYMKEGNHFDNILYLSVFHHDILKLGVEEALISLRAFRGVAGRLFFETPLGSRKVSWLDEARKDTYSFTEGEFKKRIEEETNMKVIDTWHGIRPLFLLEEEE